MENFENLTMTWIPIPEEKLKRYIEYILICNIMCDCGELIKDCRAYPYAYDMENNDMIFASKCPECGNIIFTRE